MERTASKKTLLMAAALVLAVVAGGFWYFTSGSQGDAQNTLVLQGNVDMRQVSLAFNGSGRIASLPVHEGERVQQGQLLGELDSTTLALQVKQSEAQLAAYRNQLTEKGSGLMASMLRDVEKGGPTEADHILGDMVARAESHGIAAPWLRLAYSHLQAYDARRQAAAG